MKNGERERESTQLPILREMRGALTNFTQFLLNADQRLKHVKIIGEQSPQHWRRRSNDTVETSDYSTPYSHTQLGQSRRLSSSLSSWDPPSEPQFWTSVQGSFMRLAADEGQPAYCMCLHVHTHTQYIAVFIHPFKQYRLTTYYMTDTVIGTKDRILNKTVKTPILMELTFNGENR